MCALPLRWRGTAESGTAWRQRRRRGRRAVPSAKCAGSLSIWSTYFLVLAFMLPLPFLKHAGDDLVERRVLHADVHHRVAVENDGQQLRHPAALDAQVGDGPLPTGDFAELLQVGRHVVGELQLEQL